MTVMGIDVSKGKSTIAAVNNNGELVLGPYDVEHNKQQLQLSLSDSTRVAKCRVAGKYRQPIANEEIW